MDRWRFTRLPHGLGFATAPPWWPLPMLVIGAVLTAAAIRYLPGRGGPSPAGGFALLGLLAAGVGSLIFTGRFRWWPRPAVSRPSAPCSDRRFSAPSC
jgi:hypothetical protein